MDFSVKKLLGAPSGKYIIPRCPPGDTDQNPEQEQLGLHVH